MAWTLESHWKPTRLLEVAGSVDTSTGATEVTTDAGSAYIKPLGNRQGPHVLATDWVGTHLAKWLGLSTFEIAILRVENSMVFELPRGAMAEPGPAFVARAASGDAWTGSPKVLKTIINPADITRLVVFDTWTLNCDRYDGKPGGRAPNYNNVFLSTDDAVDGKSKLIAMDHGLCFIRSGEDLTIKLGHLERVRDEHLYGLFPAFRAWLRADIIGDCVARLRELDTATVDAMIATVPEEWDVSKAVRQAWSELIYRRASFVADHIEKLIESVAPWFGAQGE